MVSFKIENNILVSCNNNNDECDSIIIPDGVETIGEFAFDDICFKSIKIPSSVIHIEEYVLKNCRRLFEIEVSTDNKIYASYDGCLYNKDKSVLLVVPRCKRNFEIYEKTVIIANIAAAYCKNLEEIIIPQNVKIINDGAFKSCEKLETVKLHEGLEYIGNEVFSECLSLKSLTIPGTVKDMKLNSFSECHDFKTLEFSEGIKVIRSSVLCNSPIENLIIPSSVEYIGENVCADCKNLKNIILSKDNKNFYLKDGAVYDRKTDICILCPESLREQGLVEDSSLTFSEIYLNEDRKSLLLGDWPQSLKEKDVLIDERKEYLINGWTCYKGSDNSYYVRRIAAPYYSLMDIMEDELPSVYFLDKKTKIEDNYYYYFKMESIKWDILSDEYQGGKLLLARKVLMCHYFYDSYNVDIKERRINNNVIHDNNYEYSDIRAYLNNIDGSSYNVEDYSNFGFLNMAFTKTAQKKLKEVMVSNDVPSILDFEEHKKCSNNVCCSDTYDKVFLLSERDATNPYFNFPSYTKKGPSCVRTKQITDFVKCMGITFFENEMYDNTSMWWLRSPHTEDGFNVQYVGYGGSCDENTMDAFYITGGVVPAIVI